MFNRNQLIVSARDAAALARMLGRHRRAHPFEADASDDLADLLMSARLVPTDRLPADRVAMGAPVTYREEPAGAHRTVTLACPDDADASKGVVSVLSPVGLALIGRKHGALIEAALPGDRALKIRVIHSWRGHEPLRTAA